MALTKRRPPAGLIHHSDRGSRYAATAYQEALRVRSIRGSMSREGNCRDNAPMESFFGTPKAELVHGRRYGSRDEARRDLFGFIEAFYDRRRRHSALGYRSLAEFARLAEAA